jgi:hypothetical protein
MALVFLLISLNAEAGRLSGGRKMGRQSSNVGQQGATPPAAPAQQSAQRPAQAAPAPMAQPAPRRPWGAMLGGLAAGLGLAWLAHSMGFGAEFGNILMFALLVEGIHLMLPFENLWRIGAAALPPGLGQQLMGTLNPLLALEHGRRLYRLRLRLGSGTGKPSWLATDLSPAGLCSHSGRWSIIQQNSGEGDATPDPSP